eukprot:CCRYP_017264-RA/>CCRYP_017264-RA protein AED:0.47 eAED:0.47 QI:0/0/0/1/0/0/2/0/134
MKTISETQNVATLPGRIQAQKVVTLGDLRLPEFDKNRQTSQQKALVFDNNKVNTTSFWAGMKLNFSKGRMEWFDCSLPLHQPGGLESKAFDAMEEIFFIQAKDELFGEDFLSCDATKNFNAKYECPDVLMPSTS